MKSWLNGAAGLIKKITYWSVSGSFWPNVKARISLRLISSIVLKPEDSLFNSNLSQHLSRSRLIL